MTWHEYALIIVKMAFEIIATGASYSEVRKLTVDQLVYHSYCIRRNRIAMPMMGTAQPPQSKSKIWTENVGAGMTKEHRQIDLNDVFDDPSLLK